ncbi:MAG TPA: hypothetical protein VH210_11645 [Gaiellaceae bacterium]|jgi:cytoskeletal protein RodZ|nr:hypothetical protein [Gaiellaceae bacterium]
MASKQKRVEDAKKRDKRSKIVLVALGLLLVVVAAYEIPSMLALMNKKPPTSTTHAPAPSSVVAGSGLPSVATAGTTGSTATTPSGQLVNSDVPPASAEGQLVTFEVFQTKNPFVPQVTSSVATTGTSTTPTLLNHQPNSTTSTTPTTTTPNSAVPSAGGSGTTPTSTPPAPPPAPTVTIAVNGVDSRVGVAGTFPVGAPVFRLVSFQSGTAQVGVVGGSYAAGGATLTLQVGHPVTLQNTTDGKQYKLELIKTP